MKMDNNKSTLDDKTSLQRKLLLIYEEEFNGNDQVALKRYFQAILAKVADCRKSTKVAKELLKLEYRKNMLNKDEIESLRLQVKCVKSAHSKYEREVKMLRAENAEWKRQVACANDEICKFKAWATATGYSPDSIMASFNNASVKK
jgi:hypothetical protein